jgi:hypothetical protein
MESFFWGIKSCRLLVITPRPCSARGSWLSSGRGLAAKPHHQRPKKVAFRFTRLIPVGDFSRKIPDRARDFASRLDFGKHLPIVGRRAKKFGLERCPTSAPVRQIRRIEEGRISGSS